MSAVKDCACPTCVNCCASGNPGWFMPGEAEKAAAFLDMTFESFKAKFLVRDWWAGHEDFEVLAPIKTIPDPSDNKDQIMGMIVESARARPGGRAPYAYPAIPGRCVFLDEKDRCKIHPVKPFECRNSSCELAIDQPHPELRRGIVAAWIRFWRKEARCGS